MIWVMGYVLITILRSVGRIAGAMLTIVVVSASWNQGLYRDMPGVFLKVMYSLISSYYN